MYKINLLALLFFVVFLGCKEEDDLVFLYEDIVDASFYCNMTVNGEEVSFPFHDRPTFGTEIYGDSILIKAFLNFAESDDPYVNQFAISVCKKYKISDLMFTVNDNGNPYNAGVLSNEEFQIFFNVDKYNYSYLDCSVTSCNKSEGIELTFDSFYGNTYKTEWLYNSADKTEALLIYKNANFSITKIEWLSKDAVVFEGEFETGIYTFNGNEISITNGTFKAFCRNITYPEVIDKNQLWNKNL